MIQFWLPKTASWGPFGAWFLQIPQIPPDSSRSFFNVRIVFSPRPPLVGPTCLQSVPKGPQNIRKVALDVLLGPHKISMDKIPALGFFISANLKKVNPIEVACIKEDLQQPSKVKR